MSVELVQAERWLTLDTPLGPDKVVSTEAMGEEGISRLFEFTVSAMSSEQQVKPQDLLGKNVTLTLAYPGGKPRFVNGIVTAFAGGAMERSDYRHYRITISPTLWVLDRTSDYKVFQEKSCIDIAKVLLDEAGVEYQVKLRGSYEPRDYCVQFGETNLEFLHRLFAEEGIFYFFTHAKGKHVMVIADHAQAYGDCTQGEVVYRSKVDTSADTISEMNFGVHLTDTKWSLRDYDFTSPSALVEGSSSTTLKPASSQSWEQFRYPGDSTKAATLKARATARIEAVEAGFEVVTGASTCASFTPGHRFKLAEHPVDALAGSDYVLTEVRHHVVDTAFFAFRATKQGEDEKPFCRNRFSCLPRDRVARGGLAAQKPIVRGPLTAVVVGPKGEEIHTDKYGRIRVQFHWDRVGKSNETSSCFVRVAQAMAGSGWGSLFIPRIGMEVVVQFLDGDPDRPLVTGTVYNGDNMPPWALPANMTKSGFLTRSTKQGAAANANELSFEDKKGSERILFHAEKDFTREVENDDKLEVGNDQTRTITNNRTTTITKGNDSYTLKQGNLDEKLETGNRTVTISKGNETLDITTGNRKVTLATGNDALTLSKGNHELTLSLGNQTTKAAAGKITLDATMGILLKCGNNTIEISPMGIKINGIQIEVKADVKIDAKAAMLNLSGDGMLIAKGGIVKIN